MKRYVDMTALVLASGLTVSIVTLTVGVVWSAIKNGSTAATLTENETQVLISAFGGIFGILGAYIGYQLGNGARKRPHSPFDDSGETQSWPARPEAP